MDIVGCSEQISDADERMSGLGKPRLGESAEELWRAIKAVNGGVVASEAGGRLIYPTLRVVGGEDFQLSADGSLRIVVQEAAGAGVRDASRKEADEFHRDLEGDRVQVILMSPPGYGSDYKIQRILRELHSPSGLSFKPPASLASDLQSSRVCPKDYEAGLEAAAAECQRLAADHPLGSESRHAYEFASDNILAMTEPEPIDGAQEGDLPFGKWYVGAMNDALFLINTPPRPSTDDAWHERPDGPSMSIPVPGLTVAQAQAICDAHNVLHLSALESPADDDPVVSALTLTAAALQAVCKSKRIPSEDDVISSQSGESKTIGEILDMADAAIGEFRPSPRQVAPSL